MSVRSQDIGTQNIMNYNTCIVTNNTLNFYVDYGIPEKIYNRYFQISITKRPIPFGDTLEKS